jgi:hypothetical protein
MRLVDDAPELLECTPRVTAMTLAEVLASGPPPVLPAAGFSAGDTPEVTPVSCQRS